MNLELQFKKIFKMFFLVLLIALSVSYSEDLQVHNLRFFLDPNLVSGMDFNDLKSNLSQYAEEINNVFAKQTIRRIVFDPDTGITITETKPYSDSYFSLPEQDYELWVHAVLSDTPGTKSPGFATADINGAGVVAGMKLDQLYNPSELVDSSYELEDYWWHIHVIVHELGHVFGAGISEYYNIATVNDTTEIEPIVDIVLEPTNAYWNKRQDYFTDPLLTCIYNNSLVGSPTGLQELRDIVAFADVTVSVVNRGPRNWDSSLSTLPNLTESKVEVRDARTMSLISDANVRVWNGRSYPPYEHEEISVMPDINEGTYKFYWDCNNAFNTTGHLKLIKAFAPDYEAETEWFSVFDAVTQKMVYGKDELRICVYLMPVAGTYLVNMHDFAMMAAAWKSEEGQEEFDGRIDLLADGLIDWNDLEVLTSYWLIELPN